VTPAYLARQGERMFIITKSTVTNSAVLETRSLPKRFFGRVLVLPHYGSVGLWARILLEIQLLRYLVTLMPFVLLVFISGEVALTVSQAPVIMLMVIFVMEFRILRMPKAARQKLVSADDAARRLDMLTFRARACLRQIAARRQMAQGTLHLVIEQSDFARVAPLTLVTVQTDHPEPLVLALEDEDIAILQAGLFDTDLTERDLLQVNLRDETYLRDIAQDTRGVSAHARLAAWMDRKDAS
jgi:hypothetical protein